MMVADKFEAIAVLCVVESLVFDFPLLVKFRAPQASSRLLVFESQAEINAVLCRGLHAGERPALRHERDITLARLDDDLLDLGSGVNDGIKDRSEVL